jgi:transposase
VACDPRAELDAQKKTIHASEQDEAQRAAFVEHLATLQADDLVVIDESGTRIGMTPLYARAPRGQRAVDRTPRNYGHTYSLIAAMSLQGMEASMLLDGAVDQTAFLAYLRDFLLPTLGPGQLIIMDNLSVHKGTSVQHLIEAHGCHILFLPPYSPIFRPLSKPLPRSRPFCDDTRH